MAFDYPDKNDQKTSVMINTYESYPGYWKKSEEKVLDCFERYMNTGGVMLDAGCGEGRLIYRFATRYDEVIGIEPDQSRYETALQISDELPHVNIIKGTIIDFRGEADDILCSHVIQHLPEKDVDEIFRHFRSCIKKGGNLFLTTNHSIREKSCFSKTYFDEGALIEKEISREEFNEQMPHEILRIKSFTLMEIQRLLNEQGFEPLEMKVFHHRKAYQLLDGIFGVDYFINRNRRRQDLSGRDMMVVAKRI